MPEVDGLEVLRRAGELSPETPLIVVSGTGCISDSVQALRLGAWDYILKPIDDISLISLAVQRALERARLLRENRSHQENLETIVRERTAELEAKNAELERFTYTVSHDLKSPLITIKGYVGMLRKDLAEANEDSIEDDLRRIANAADKMGQLLDDLLELSRVGRLVNLPQRVPLRELVEEAIELLRGQIEVRNVHVQIAPNLPVAFGDRARLLEVLQNLIDNAVKYMGDQPDPVIEIDTRRDGNETVCYVRDNGVGIEPRFHDKIFRLFDQLDPKVEGSGIGLALAKRIVELHGGRIWVESPGSGQGSVFGFTLSTEPAARTI
jgi:signal transduction histidine kinase